MRDPAMLTDVLDALSDRVIVGLTLYGEARGEPIEGQIAVACVMRNRVQDPKLRWPGGYRFVCLQPRQFSCWNEGDPNLPKLLRVAEQARISQHDPVMLQCLWIAQGVCDDFVQDVTRGANHYHSDGIAAPSWAEKMVLTAKKGHHIFYRG